MAVEARVSFARGWLPESALDRLLSVLGRCALPVSAAELPVPVRASAIVAATEKVRLIRAGSLRWVLPLDLGDTVIADDVDDDEIRRALADCGILE
jgi:3-dehydroquinate synthase